MSPYSEKKDRKAYADRYYRQNRERIRAANKATHRRTRLSRVEMIRAIKEDQPCDVCGEKYPPEAMDLDHIDPNAKHYKMRRSGGGRDWYALSDAEFREEIKKVRVICAICHRVHSRAQRAQGIQMRLMDDCDRPQLALFGDGDDK